MNYAKSLKKMRVRFNRAMKKKSRVAKIKAVIKPNAEAHFRSEAK